MTTDFSSYFFLFLIFLSGIGFSVQEMIVKILSNEGYHNSFEIIFVRGFVQFLFMLLAVVTDGGKDRFNGFFGDNKYTSLILLLRCCCGGGSIMFAFLSIQFLPLGDAAVLVMMSPLYAGMLSALFLGESWRLPDIVGVIAALIGGVLVVRPPFIFHHDSSDIDPRGVAYGIIASLCGAGSYTTVRMLGTSAKLSWKNVNCAQGIAQMFMSLPTMYLFNFSFDFNPSFRHGCMMLGCGLIGTVSLACMTYGMQREKSAIGTAMRMSDILFAFIFQSLFTHDKVELLSVVGATLVAGSIALMIIFKEKVSQLSTFPSLEMKSMTGRPQREPKYTAVQTDEA